MIMMIILLSRLFVSYDLLKDFCGGDDYDEYAVERSDIKLSEQPGKMVTIDFNNLTDLPLLFMFHYPDEREVPEWIVVSDPSDTTYLKPERDNGPGHDRADTAT